MRITWGWRNGSGGASSRLQRSPHFLPLPPPLPASVAPNTWTRPINPPFTAGPPPSPLSLAPACLASCSGHLPAPGGGLSRWEKLWRPLPGRKYQPSQEIFPRLALPKSPGMGWSHRDSWPGGGRSVDRFPSNLGCFPPPLPPGDPRLIPTAFPQKRARRRRRRRRKIPSCSIHTLLLARCGRLWTARCGLCPQRGRSRGVLVGEGGSLSLAFLQMFHRFDDERPSEAAEEGRRPEGTSIEISRD